MESISKPNEIDEAVFTINGKLYKADSSVPLYTSLNTYIRDYALLPGTKYSCKEGSCGSCVVNLKYTDKSTKKKVSVAVNSCLTSVFSCHGCAVTTVEGIGSRVKGYNKIQTTLASFSGTQCGFCSPGFVMSMYSLLDANPNATVTDVENNFSSNICRCTGYRPILDAFKSLSSNPPIKLKQKLLEIEDSHLFCQNIEKCKELKGEECCKPCQINSDDEEDDNSFELDFSELTLSKENFYLQANNQEWYRACCLKEIFQIFIRIGSKSYMLVAGNTAQGIQKPKTMPDVYIDVNNVDDLKGYSMTSSNLTFGSVNRLFEYINRLRSAAKNKPNLFGYGQQMADHLSLVANVAVRNRATIGGNLAYTNENNNFPSDIFLLLDAIGATITIALPMGLSRTLSTTEFLTYKLNKKVITKVTLPAQNKTSVFKSYKIMPVNQNAIAIVNGAFYYDVDTSGKLNRKPSLVISGINALHRHAYKTESYLSGRNIFNSDVIKHAVSTLWSEIIPDNVLTRFSPTYRKLLATAIFYRSILSIAGDRADKRLRSGATNLVRPISSGKQVYQSDKKEYPLTQPIPKLESQIQCAGEAMFINDLPKLKQELVGQLVLAKKFADIEHIDPSKALKIPGVVAFYSAKDIPGKNNVSFPFIIFTGDIELFSSGKINFWGQPVGMIVAETEDIADIAVNQVIITYKPRKTPLLTIRDVLNSKEKDKRVVLKQTQKATKSGEGGIYDVAGEVDITSAGQYAHAIETPVCRVLPNEDGQYTVYSSTQTITVTVTSIAQVMGISLNKIDCIVPRVGGSYGSKNTSQLYSACSCTLAASKLQRPVRMAMKLSDEMDSIGKRNPFLCRYTGKCDKQGKIQGLEIDLFVENGFTTLMDIFIVMLPCIVNYFDPSTWNINIYYVFTDKTPMVILRGPGFMEPISIIEQIMDHVAFISKQSPESVRIVNAADQIAVGYINDWIKQTDFNQRKQDIDKFNQDNRWKKKGLSLSSMRYPFDSQIVQISCTVNILFPDGTVQIQHGGIEMGQGINTKVAQAVAEQLGIPLSTIQVKKTTSLSAPNNTPSWLSLTSELAVYSAIGCCKELNSNLEPVKKSLTNPTWKQIVETAFNQHVPLSATVPLGKYPDKSFGKYYVYGVAVTETELDVLTGQYQLTRVDILEDVGKSMSPDVDVGQVEGAFVMGVGLHTLEKLVYDPKTAALLTDRLWFYHAPRSLDIPIDFRVTFVPNATNPVGVLNSKGTGEPAIALAVSVVTSIRYGLMSARNDAGLPNTWIPLDSPCTPETILMASGTTKEQFIL